jgi:glycine/D-amino acid oxidase-like deaminating enzyme
MQFDVCIVGGGLSGLWTAFYLSAASPGLRIAIVEAEFVGFGASGRNGGWLSSELAGSWANYAKGEGGQEAVERLENELFATVDEVIDVCAQEHIDADIIKSGVLLAARSNAQMARMHSALSGHSGYSEIPLVEFNDRIRISGNLGGVFNPQCARVHPAKLVDGLRRVVQQRGVTIFEDSRVIDICPGKASTSRGEVQAPIILRCLEGFTAQLSGHKRDWLPMNSAMIATIPLTPAQWDDIGWNGSELLGDLSNVYFYAQRTADGRIAIGGRGVPYRFASKSDVDGITQERTISSLRRTFDQLFPSLRQVPLDHAWCGVLGVPRDWCASVGLDQSTGLGWAGGYVGSGLAATNLVGRTLRDLVLERPSPLIDLPWTNRTSRRWEPEPLRWIGVSSLYGVYRAADRHEASGRQQPSWLSTLGNRLAGR